LSLIKGNCSYTYSKFVTAWKYQNKTSAFSFASFRHNIAVNLAVANSSVSTQFIHANTFSQTISFDGTSHCCRPLYTSALIDFSLTCNTEGHKMFNCLLLSDILCTITTCNVRSV